MKPHSLQAARLAIIILFSAARECVASSSGVLTNAADVLSLTAEQAKQEIEVAITGVVTVAEPTPNWKGKFFVQDATGGVFVNNTKKLQPLVGDVVQVRGVSAIREGMRLTFTSRNGKSWARLRCRRLGRFPPND